MIGLALTTFLTLTATAALLAMWGVGVHWPAPDERALVALVVGHSKRTRMPSTLKCFGTSAAMLLAGIVALAVVDLVAFPGPSYLISAAGALVALGFAARGAAAYVPAWRRRFAQEPFATLDKSWYAPICLLLATTFAVLVIKRLVS
jgi:Protein of unknown function (DUF3995)